MLSTIAAHGQTVVPAPIRVVPVTQIVPQEWLA